MILSHSWIILTFVATLLWASTNILDKYILSRLVKNPLLPLLFFSVVGLGAASIIFLFRQTGTLTTDVKTIVLFAGACYTLSIFLYFKAATFEEISKIVALWYVSPIFTAILGWLLLGETFTMPIYIGIVLLAIGAFTIEVSNFRISFGKGFWLMMVSSFFLACNYVAVKYALESADFWTVFAWARVGSFIAVFPLVYGQFTQMINTIRTFSKKTVVLMSTSETLGIAGVVFITAAAETGSATLVSAFSTIQPLFVFIFSIIVTLFFPRMFKETLSRRVLLFKAVAIVCIITGAVLLV